MNTSLAARASLTDPRPSSLVLSLGFRRAASMLAVASYVLTSSLSAATLTVTNLKDSGPGSLSHMLSKASIGDTITFKGSLFSANASSTIVLNNSLTIDKSLTLIGPGDYFTVPAAGDVQGARRPRLVLRGTASQRVLRILSSGEGNAAARPVVTISGITFTGGDATSSHFGGGAILVDGGASLTLERCDIVNNRAYFGGGVAAGWREGVGGSQLTLVECLVAGNQVITSGSIEESARGGGIGSIDSVIIVRRSLIASNRTDQLGGGFGGSHGGGVYAIGGTVVVDNSTIAGNRALFGGGAAFLAEGTPLSVTLASSTVVDNFADDSFNGGADGGGLCARGAAGLVTFTNTIVARNALLPANGGAPISSDFAALPDGVFGTGRLSSNGHNLLGVPAGFTPAPSDLVGVDPLLDPRADNGGRTFTYALRGGSPAINAGNPSVAGAANFFDQRGAGFPRVAGTPGSARIDIGAYEFSDTVPPTIQLVGDTVITRTLGQVFVDPGYLASDNSGIPIVTRTVNGVPNGTIDTCKLGTYSIVYTAADSFGNTASVSRTVQVTAPTVTITVPAEVPLQVVPGLCAANAKLSDLAVITGLPASCALSVLGEVTPPGASSAASYDASTVVKFPLGTSMVKLTVTAPTVAGGATELAAELFAVVVTDPFSTCLANIAWPLAQDLPMSPGGGTNQQVAIFQQMLLHPGESRWFRFVAAPGGQINLTLTNLPANFDLIVYSNIQTAYNELTALIAGDAQDKALGLLGTEFAAERRSPEAYSPDAFARPEAYSPDAFAAAKIYSPEAYSPDGYAAPEAYSPDVFAAPEAYSPEDLAARNISSPEAYSPDAYSAAQQRSLIAFSAAPGTISEGIRFNTYSTGGVFYVRIRGQQGVYSTDAPFDLAVTVTEGLCQSVDDLNTTPALAPSIPAAAKSLFIWDSSRITGSATEISALSTSLATFAAAANGAVVDVATDTRIGALNAQADANPFCPLAKNLVAEAIRTLIQNIRAAHPAVADITLIGNDSVIPFFRTDDEANLGNEVLYYPPVLNATQSQTSLRYNQVLTQDRYGSSSQVVLATGPYDLPEIPVARLVETAVEVKAYVDAYLPLFAGAMSTGGVLPTPQSGFVAAYDFMADSGAAIRAEFLAGLNGGTVDALISPIDEPPAQGWTADQLRDGFLATRHDIVHLAAHFSTSSALAADYVTRIRAAELTASPVDLKFALILSNGCHSGYNTVDADAIAGVTDQPDWAQTFARKKALWVSGTGYQYGDTDFIDYTERLLLEYAQVLRTGTGPVALGQALVDAKRRYLSETALMRGIHEKSLLQLALYGLPMVKINLPGRLVSTPAPAGAVSPSPVSHGPGVANSLRAGDLAFATNLTRVDQTFTVLDSSATITASYFTGPNGFVPVPGEPVRPLHAFNVHSAPAGFVRGVGFRGGSYQDLGAFRPFTGAPGTELSTVHGKFDSPSFFPVQPWSVNQLGFLTLTDGYTVLNTFPTQFMSDPANPEGDTGILRKYGQMQFTVFYCPLTSNAALANAPALNFVASTSDAQGVHVTVDAAATTAGVQEVWVCFTGLPGSTYYGSWQPFTLTGPSNTTGNGTWAGTLPLAPGSDPTLIRFFVQAVNGFGAVSANTNVGRYFGIGESTLDGIGTASAPTNIAFLGSPPSNGKYGELLPLQAQLTNDQGQPLVGKVITFQAGSAARSAVTNSSGIASTSLRLNTPPTAGDLQATFAGDTVYRNAVASLPFTVGKQNTTLSLSPDGSGPVATHIFATLTAPGDLELKERALLFLANNGTTTTAIAEITNGAGVARLSPEALLPGTYQVSVYFGQTVTLPGGVAVVLDDPLYLPAQDSGTFTIEAPPPFPLVISSENVSVTYGDATAPRATSKNRGHSRTTVNGRIAFVDTSLNFAAITPTTATSLSSFIRIKLSNRQLFAGNVLLHVTSNPEPQWEGSVTINGTTIQLYVNWLPSRPDGHVSLDLRTAPGTGPLYKDAPAILECEVILGSGADEHPARASLSVGDSLKPWTKESTNSRSRVVQ